MFQSTHSLWSATNAIETEETAGFVSIHALLVECDRWNRAARKYCPKFQSTHSLWSATHLSVRLQVFRMVSIHALLVECDRARASMAGSSFGFNPRTPCGVRRDSSLVPGRQVQFQSTHSLWSATKLLRIEMRRYLRFQSTHSLWSATAPDLIHCYSTEQIILCANLPKKTVIARLLFLSIYLSIFYSQCITPIADLPGNSCELEVGAQAMFNSL